VNSNPTLSSIQEILKMVRFVGKVSLRGPKTIFSWNSTVPHKTEPSFRASSRSGRTQKSLKILKDCSMSHFLCRMLSLRVILSKKQNNTSNYQQFIKLSRRKKRKLSLNCLKKQISS